MFIIPGHDDGRDGVIDVDPEVVRKGVRNLMQQVAQIERERVGLSNGDLKKNNNFTFPGRL